MSHRADEVKVGVLVIVTGLLLFIAIIMVSRYSPLSAKPHFHKARFTYVGGLSQGSPVRFGGLSVGRVESVKVMADKGSNIEVEVSVSADTPVKRDSEAAITSLGLLGDNYVEISLGTPQSDLLPSGEYLKNRQYPGMNEILAKADSAMVDAQKLIKDLNLQVNRISDKADTLLTDLDKTVDENNRRKLASILDETDKMIKSASPKVSETLSHIQTASSKIDPMLENFKATLTKVDKLLENLDATVAENRPEIRKTLQDLDKTLLDARSAILDMRSMLQFNRGNIDTLIENLAASSDNIREFTDTVKQHPFSLIRMPPKKTRVPPEIQK